MKMIINKSAIVSNTSNNNGFIFFKNYLTNERQQEILKDLEILLEESPPFINIMWNGQPFKVMNSNAGLYGWYSHPSFGYRYQTTHPETNLPWPKIPESILKIIKELTESTGYLDFRPECCYINLYPKEGSLGPHRDESETNLTAPIISISLGDTAQFHLGGKERKDKSEKILIESGDCYIQGGESRMFYHSVKKILPGTSDLVSKEGGRINLTIRQVEF